MDASQLKSNDRVYRWWDAGSTVDLQPLTIVRVNRATVTVRTDQGNVFRMSPDGLAGFYTDET